MNMYASILIKATQAGAAELKKYFNGSFEISKKEGLNNLVTEADFAADKAIIQVIKESFPQDGIISEESEGQNDDAEYKWIIDPIDGTVNFSNGIPICCVSVALQYKSEIIMGAVYNPIIEEFFMAEKGKGATLNGKPIRVSEQKNIDASCLATGFPYTYVEMANDPLTVFSRFIKKGIPVRRFGSAAIDLCWVAAGRFDGYYEHHLKPWDSAAGFLIVLEAGGKVTHFSGAEYSPFQEGIVATNGRIHAELIDWITKEK